MANRTDPAAKSIRGTNPQNLVEKILRSKIYQNTYWKEQCFGLTAETLVDKAMELDHLGGTHGGNRKPTPFMCLVMKMLQIQPEKEIVIEFIKNDDYKYLSLSLSLHMCACVRFRVTVRLLRNRRKRTEGGNLWSCGNFY
jgi:pre-mRNA-splicing factor 38A